MRVPRQLLRETITVREYTGSGARGPIYSSARTMRAQLQRTDEAVQDSHGVVVQVQDLAVVRPEDGPVGAEALVEAHGEDFRVVRCYAMPDERRPYFYQLQLARFKPGTRSAPGVPGSGS